MPPSAASKRPARIACAPERGLLVAEQLGRGESFGERGAVQRDERRLRARGPFVDESCEDVLADAGLAEHEDRQGALRRAGGFFVQADHRGRAHEGERGRRHARVHVEGRLAPNDDERRPAGEDGMTARDGVVVDGDVRIVSASDDEPLSGADRVNRRALRREDGQLVAIVARRHVDQDTVGAGMGIVALLAFLATKGLARSRVTTALLLFAVTAGVGLQIPNSANLRGYTANLFEEATSRGFGDVRAQHATEPILDDGDAVARDLASVPGVRAAVPIVSLAGAIEVGGRNHVAEVQGVDVDPPFKPYRIRAGADLSRGDEGVLVGTALAARLGVKPGDTVRVRILFPAHADIETYGSSPNVAEYTMTVRGTAAGTFGAYLSLFVSRDLMLRAMAREHAATRVLLYAGSQTGSAGVSTASRVAPKETDALARAVSARRPDLRPVTWMVDHPYADSAIRANETLGIVSHTMVVIAVTIPIAALLFVTVESRRREIAMLAALGFRRREIFVAFILQALAVGIAGGLLGCAVGWLAVRAFDAHPIFESADFVVRPVITASAFYEPALVVLLATALAAAYPAYRATRVDPARVLRGLA